MTGLRTKQDGGSLVEALRRIADSYPWEPYEEGECVTDHPGIPTNRRIAREALNPPKRARAAHPTPSFADPRDCE